MTFTEFGEKVRGFLDNATSQIAAWMAKKDVEYKEKVAVNQIQAQGALRNAQRMAMREMPVVLLNPAQEEALLFPEFRGQGARIQLDHAQADAVMNHMIKQHSLDAESREKLADTVAPLVGVPTLLEPVYMAHRYIGERLILPYANHGKPDEYKKGYEYFVHDPVYTGTNQGICLKFNIHSADLCRKFCREYEHSRKYIAKLVNGLQRIGVQIDHVSADGIYLEVYLKWTGV